MTNVADLEPGRRVGNYLIDRRLGEGGMGVVYLADDPRHDRQVAIKVVRRDGLADPKVTERFRREQRILAGLSHPNILPLLESGQQDDEAYFVTPYQPSGDLRVLLAERQLTLTEVARITRQVADALSAAHRAGIVHRDVKPGNILVAHQDDLSVFLADFGLSYRPADPRLTGTGAVQGTFAYMAPEQLAGRRTTTVTDVYALAVTTHEMATGRSRCDGSCVIAAVAPRLYDVIRRGMATDPSERYPTATDFADAVTAAASPSGATVIQSARAPSVNSYLPPAIDSVDESLEHPEVRDQPTSRRPLMGPAPKTTTPRASGVNERTDRRRSLNRPQNILLTLGVVLIIATLILILSPWEVANTPPSAPAGASNLTVCAESVRIRDKPESVKVDAHVLGILHQGDQFLAYPSRDDHWVEGFAYSLGKTGWVERRWLSSPCPG